MVEFVADETGIAIQGAEGKYRVVPVEYKRGKPKNHDSDIMQLVAQAMGLEEMLLCKIDTGYIYYNAVKRRTRVEITDDIRTEVRSMRRNVSVLHSKIHSQGKNWNSLPELFSERHLLTGTA